jgi:signal transduction histidine kinase/DNA-binding response OmpR family regulator
MLLHLDSRFLPIFDSIAPETNYAGVYNPWLVGLSVVIAILAAYVALSISGRIVAATTGRARRAWICAGAIVMGGGIWAMHFIGMLAFSLECGTGYNPLGTVASVIPGILASAVALSVISRQEQPSFVQLTVGAVLMGAGIGAMHYSGMAAMEPEALLRYDPVWVGISVVVAVALAFVALSIRFRFPRRELSKGPATLVAATVMGCGVACMHYTAMRASLFFPVPDVIGSPMTLPPTTLAVMITIVTVMIASITLVASFAGRQAELAISLRAEIAERERGEKELIQARHQAEEASRAKSDFLATMSHEIRTPLNGVIGMANLLASTPLNERQAQLVDSLARSGRTLLALINDILDFSRIEAHELELFDAPFEIREVIAEVTDLFGEQCATRGLDLIYSIPESVPVELLGDAVRLRQILINLVGNAMKFTEEGQILIELAVSKKAGDEIAIAFCVEDTGIGIAADKLDQIFEPFRQADASMTRSRGGSGLGLAITRHLVELAGGTIAAESELGRGSRFFFTLAFRGVPAPDEGQEGARHIPRALRTLLVDTNAVSARVISQYLASWQVPAARAGTVRKARTIWEKATAAGKPFDVVIIDLKGLAGAGIELARAIRGDARAAETQIVLLVGMNNLVDDAVIQSLGAFATLSKPARPSALFDCFVAIAANARSNDIAARTPRRGVRGASASFDAKVLVVEDNPVNQEVASGILENLDCRVVTAANGRCAVDKFANETFDLVLMDCEMPVMDGFAAADGIRKIEAAATGDEPKPRTPIVALTAHALAEIREKCLRSGMDDFLVKPFDEVQIRDVLRRWVPSREQAPREKQRTTAGAAAPAAAEAIDLAVIDRIREIQGKSGTSLFERVVAQFSQTAPTLTSALRAQCDAGDTEAMWRTAHSLKSSAAALGAGTLSRRCAEIESLARDGGVDPVRQLLGALEADLTAAQTGLEELIGADHV